MNTEQDTYPWDDQDEEKGKVRISATLHVTAETDYTYNTVGDNWPFGVEVGGQLDSLLIWFDNTAAVDRAIRALHELQTRVAVKEATTAATEAAKTAEVPA